MTIRQAASHFNTSIGYVAFMAQSDFPIVADALTRAKGNNRRFLEAFISGDIQINPSI